MKKKQWFFSSSALLFLHLFQQQQAAVSCSFLLPIAPSCSSKKAVGSHQITRRRHQALSLRDQTNRMIGKVAAGGVKSVDDMEDNNNSSNGYVTAVLEKEEEADPKLSSSISEETSLLEFATKDDSSSSSSFPSLLSKNYSSMQKEQEIVGQNHPHSQPATLVLQDIWNNLWTDLPSSSILWLNLVAIIWGSQHAVIKMVVDDSDAGAFTLVRFGIGAIIATTFAFQTTTTTTTTDESKTTTSGDEEEGGGGNDNIPAASLNSAGEEEDSLLLDNSQSSSPSVSEASAALSPLAGEQETSSNNNVTTALRWGAEMGFWMFLGFAFQAVGLQSTTAQRSGFLLYLNVKFVPFLAYILLGRNISIPTWISAIIAFSGTALLAYDGSGGFFDLNTGDWWSIAAAAASAMFILRLEKASQNVTSAAVLNAACLWVVTSLAAVWTMLSGSSSSSTAESSFVVMNDPSQSSSLPQIQGLSQQVWDILLAHPLEIFYLSAITTALANYIQTKAQKDVPAERASVIYAMDPVYGAFFSNYLLGESLSNFGYIGAGMITLAAATNAFLDLSVATVNQEEEEEERTTTT